MENTLTGFRARPTCYTHVVARAMYKLYSTCYVHAVARAIQL